MIKVINDFLAAAYNKTGLKVLNDAAETVPAVRLAGASLILAMFAAVAIAAFQSNVRLLVGSVIIFVVLITLVIILGAAAKQRNRAQATFFSWVIVVLLAFVLLGITTAFLFDIPRPLNDLLLGDTPISLKGIKLTLHQDASYNLILTTSGVPQQPYTLNAHLIALDPKKELGEIKLSLPNEGNSADPIGMLQISHPLREVKCLIILSKSGCVIDRREVLATINSPQEQKEK